MHCKWVENPEINIGMQLTVFFKLIFHQGVSNVFDEDSRRQVCGVGFYDNAGATSRTLRRQIMVKIQLFPLTHI